MQTNTRAVALKAGSDAGLIKTYALCCKLPIAPRWARDAARPPQLLSREDFSALAAMAI